jgi:senataxin
LLNQRHDSLKLQDMTICGIQGYLPEVDKWIRKAMDWNKEQMQVIDGVRKAKGGMMLVMGPAATGKTLLQRFLILYFYYLGYHVLAVAPANDNVNKLARDLDEFLQWVIANKKTDKSVARLMFDFLRLFPGSRDIDPEDMDEEQAKHRKVGHEGGNVLSWNEFLIALNEQKKERVDHRKHGVAETIIRHADEKTGKLYKSILRSNKTEVISKDQNAYDILREFMDLYRRNKIDWSNKVATEKYRAAYDACKGQLVAMNRIMITTTGNVRSRELLDHWFGSQNYSGPDRRGVIVIVDEGPKDFEVNLWSPIVCEKWAASVQGVLIFGDEK